MDGWYIQQFKEWTISYIISEKILTVSMFMFWYSVRSTSRIAIYTNISIWYRTSFQEDILFRKYNRQATRRNLFYILNILCTACIMSSTLLLKSEVLVSHMATKILSHVNLRTFVRVPYKVRFKTSQNTLFRAIISSHELY